MTKPGSKFRKFTVSDSAVLKFSAVPERAESKLSAVPDSAMSKLSAVPKSAMSKLSAAHSAQWQELKLILRRLLQQENIRERRERDGKCMFLCKKCANNRQLIDAVSKGFYDTHAQLASTYIL